MVCLYAPLVNSQGSEEVHARSSLTANCKLSIDCIYRAVNFLEVQNAEPIGDSFVAIIHPNCKYDVMRDPEFISIVKYNDATRLYKGEIGMIGNVRFVVSNFAKVWRNAGAYKSGSSGPKYDVYSTLVLGKGAYKIVEIVGEGMQTIIKGLGSGGTADPLNQRASVGWKATKTAERLSEQYMVRIESVSSYSENASAN